MGNVNGREDGSSSPSGVEEEGAGNSVQEGMAAPMGHSPPHSPSATQTPPMFTPQVPVVPLQRPDEMHIPSQSRMQATSSYEDVCNERGIPTLITWSFGGKAVAVEGSWNDWKKSTPLERSGKDFVILKVLPSGYYHYRFIVDGQRMHTPDKPWEKDDNGNMYNILDVKETVAEDLGSRSSFERPPSPDSSYNNLPLGAEDFAKEPHMVPPQLQTTPLNLLSSNMESRPPLSRPQHVILNHLYIQKGSSPSVVALGSTHRFIDKHVTLVIYKNLRR